MRSVAKYIWRTIDVATRACVVILVFVAITAAVFPERVFPDGELYLRLGGGTLTGNLVMSGAGIQLNTGNSICLDDDDNSCIVIESGNEYSFKASNSTEMLINTGGVEIANGENFTMGSSNNGNSIYVGQDANGVAAGDCDAAAEETQLKWDANDGKLKFCDQTGATTGWQVIYDGSG